MIYKRFSMPNIFKEVLRLIDELTLLYIIFDIFFEQILDSKFLSAADKCLSR